MIRIVRLVIKRPFKIPAVYPAGVHLHFLYRFLGGIYVVLVHYFGVCVKIIIRASADLVALFSQDRIGNYLVSALGYISVEFALVRLRTVRVEPIRVYDNVAVRLDHTAHLPG